MTTTDNKGPERVKGLQDLPKPKVKLLTFWMLDKDMESDVTDHIICHGVWQTCAVGISEKGTRYYELNCCWPMHKNLKVGDKRKMWEDLIIYLCHQVEIKHLPKLPKPNQ